MRLLMARPAIIYGMRLKKSKVNLVTGLGLPQLVVEERHALLDLSNLLHQSTHRNGLPIIIFNGRVVEITN